MSTDPSRGDLQAIEAWSQEVEKNLGKTCCTCGQVFDPSISFCPSDGTKLSSELVTATSHELIQITTRFNLNRRKENAAAAGVGQSVSSDDSMQSAQTYAKVLDKQAELVTEGSNGEYVDKDKIANVNKPAFASVGSDGGNGASPRQSVSANLVGTTLDNQYEILSVIGKGGMSFVYKAKHLLLNKMVAIKTLLPHLTAQAHSLQRFQQEAKAASNLKHPNIIGVYNFGTTPDGEPYLVMDYVEGKSLAEEIEKYGFVSVDRAMRIFIQVADALAHAHAKGVIHRDLKPSNILLLEKDGHRDHVNLVDFGIAKVLPQDGTEALNLTQTGEVFGSPLYMSPEQCRGEKLDGRSDIYSMGCLMYETLTGRPAMPGDNTMEVLYNHINIVPAPMNGPLIVVPGQLEKIVFQTLAKDPAQRYQSMGQLCDTLRAFNHNRQTHLFGKLANRWALFWLRRKPRTVKEKATFAIAIGGILVAFLLAGQLASLYWAAADSPASKTLLIWDEDREQQSLPKDSIEDSKADLDVMYHINMANQMEANHGEKSEIINYLAGPAEYLAKRHLWKGAITLFQKAFDLSVKYNDYVSIRSLGLHLSLGQCYVGQHKYEEAARAFNQMLARLHREAPFDINDQAIFAYRLGTVYYFEGRWVPALSSLNMTYNIWTVPPTHRSHMSFYPMPTVPDQSYDYIMAASRIASSYQRLYESSLASAKPDIDSLRHAVQFYERSYQLWKDYTGPHDNNHNATIALANYVTLAHALDRTRNLNEDYKAALAGMKQFGEQSPYYGIMLQDYSNYLFDKGQLIDAVANRIRAWRIFAEAKSNAGVTH